MDVPKLLDDETNVCQGSSFRVRRAEYNIGRLRRLAQLYMAVVGWFVVVNAFVLLTKSRPLSPSVTHAILYFGIGILNLAIVLFVKQETLHSQRDIVKYERIIFGYTVITMVSGAVISLYDQADYGHIGVFIFSIVVCSAFLIMHPREVLTALGIATGTMFAGLPYVAASPDELPRLYQEVVTYVPVTYVISRIVFKAFCDHFVRGVHLARQVEANTVLNEQLTEANKQLQQANEWLEELALEDELTGLSNRRGLYDYLDREFVTDSRRPFIVIMVDVDNFKDYNDLYGHAAGDEILKHISRILADIAADTDGWVCRWGGEEFLYVAPNQNRDDLIDRCHTIVERVRHFNMPHGGIAPATNVTVSVGGAYFDAQRLEDVLMAMQFADQALYRAKGEGRDGYYVLREPVVVGGRSTTSHPAPDA